MNTTTTAAPSVATARTPRRRLAWYWVVTVPVVAEMAVGGIWDIARLSFVATLVTHLGYPSYFLVLLGTWKVLGACAMLVPRQPLLKEWAYAGAFFDYTGAAASHLLKGDGAALWVPPLAFATFTLLSWALRPPSRRLTGITPAAKMRVASWLVPILTVAAMLVVGSFTLPKGGPPQ